MGLMVCFGRSGVRELGDPAGSQKGRVREASPEGRCRCAGGRFEMWSCSLT